MERSEENDVLRLAAPNLSARAMGDAVLREHFDEARSVARLIIAQSESLGRTVEAAARVLHRLGPLGSTPQHGYTVAILQLASLMRPPGG